MAIPEAQLEFWSHQGAVQTSRDTYATVKRALENSKARYANRDIEVFLQGSYGNDTNIYAESDVDIVICCSDAFYHNLEKLSDDQKLAFHSHFNNASYDYTEFKTAVRDTLADAFGTSVTLGKKAIRIAASGARRSADVVPVFQHRRYYSFGLNDKQNFHKGVSFFTSDNQRIDNFPKHHSANLTAKHQATNSRFKPMIRVFKNLRTKLVDLNRLQRGEAPSYFIEGLLYNAPNNLFEADKSATTFNILNWLHDTTDRTEFACANDLYYLVRDNSLVCWPKAHSDKFVLEAINLWNDWN